VYEQLEPNGAEALRAFLDAQAAAMSAAQLSARERLFVAKQLKLQLHD